MNLGEEPGHPPSSIGDPAAMAPRDSFDEAMQPSPFKVSCCVRSRARKQPRGRDMRFTFELGAWCRRLLRPARGLA